MAGGSSGHGATRLRAPGDAAPSWLTPPAAPAAAEPEPAAAEPAPEPAAAAPAPEPVAAAPAPDLHAAYLAAASAVMAARAAGAAEGDPGLTEAIAARDAAREAWESAGG
jgi:hypothetical protein